MGVIVEPSEMLPVQSSPMSRLYSSSQQWDVLLSGLPLIYLADGI